MCKLGVFICFSAILFTSCNSGHYRNNLHRIETEVIKIFPEYHFNKPDFPSPAISETGCEMVLVKTGKLHYTWFDATVGNGDTFDYKRNLHGKGNQLLADGNDFPHLAKNGIHDELELRNTKTITGRSVSKITIDGRPWGSSGVGFMAEDETILSVIHADNRVVKKLGLTHCDMSRPLFHIWNISREYENYYKNSSAHDRIQLAALEYNGNEVEFKITGSRGWQESIFNDEILGSVHIEIWRELNEEELQFLEKTYKHLSKERFKILLKMLSHIHTGEMVLFYINRYGFYEGHTEYRIDPVSVALVYGLRPVEALHRVCREDLYSYYTRHFIQNPE